MVQWIEHFPYKHENWSSDTQQPHKLQADVVATYNSSSQKTETGAPQSKLGRILI